MDDERNEMGFVEKEKVRVIPTRKGEELHFTVAEVEGEIRQRQRPGVQDGGVEFPQAEALAARGLHARAQLEHDRIAQLVSQALTGDVAAVADALAADLGLGAKPHISQHGEKSAQHLQPAG